jgi:GNAT superfamily N-acetyltransferase
MPADVEPDRHEPSIRPVSFADDLVLTTGAKSDWPYFARWHYLGHTTGFTSRVFVLWRGETPIGIVMFSPPALGDEQRHEAFGRVLSPSVINKWFSMASRVVLDPRYRGAGIAATTLRDACRHHADLDEVRYIEM